MSLRAIRKRENLPYKKHPVPPQRHKKLLKNRNRSTSKQHFSQYFLQRSKSYPDITKTEEDLYLNNSQLQSKSLSDVTKLLAHHNKNNKMNDNPINAKSEVCLVKISEHSTDIERNNVISNDINEIRRNSTTQNTISLSTANIGRHDDHINNNSITSRRMSEQSLSVYSTPSSTVMSPSDYENRGFADTSGVRIPIIGYEIMEERARFTVYKLRVENPFTNDCWLVLRRYTDFVRLNNKLKQTFPSLNSNLQLPRKKIFGDNFNAVFLDNRVQGLQIFVNTIMGNEELKSSKVVREFFCLDEPPSYSESMEECRAIFEAQEETIAHLKLQINSKNDLIISLQQKLINEIADNDRLKKELKDTTSECANCCKKLESLGISH